MNHSNPLSFRPQVAFKSVTSPNSPANEQVPIQHGRFNHLEPQFAYDLGTTTQGRTQQTHRFKTENDRFSGRVKTQLMVKIRDFDTILGSRRIVDTGVLGYHTNWLE